ncbi:hypothetical protein Xekk_03455 [Xenorhabdus sp. KK7.4]|nr:hypothetical protein Xekk_03455 [Xenorhabdus sp. KK7.4]
MPKWERFIIFFLYQEVVIAYNIENLNNQRENDVFYHIRTCSKHPVSIKSFLLFSL